MAVAGIGSGALVAALPAAAAAAAPADRTGFVTGMTNTTKTIGGAIASSVFAIALATTGSHRRDAAAGHAPLRGLPHRLVGLRGHGPGRGGRPARRTQGSVRGQRLTRARTSYGGHHEAARPPGVSMSEEQQPSARAQRARIEEERDERTGRSAAAERIRNQTRWVDLQVQRAMERGEFDDLPGAGKPLDLPDKHDPDWWVKQLIEREQITGIAPAGDRAAQGGRRARRAPRPRGHRGRRTPGRGGLQRTHRRRPPSAHRRARPSSPRRATSTPRWSAGVSAARSAGPGRPRSPSRHRGRAAPVGRRRPRAG